MTLRKLATLVAVSGFATAAGADEPSRLYLQQVGSHTAVVKWRGASWSPANPEKAPKFSVRKAMPA